MEADSLRGSPSYPCLHSWLGNGEVCLCESGENGGKHCQRRRALKKPGRDFVPVMYGKSSTENTRKHADKKGIILEALEIVNVSCFFVVSHPVKDSGSEELRMTSKRW